MLTESCKKVAEKFRCETCDYSSSRKSSYDKHVMTSKHIKKQSVNNMLTESCKKVANVEENIQNDNLLCKNCNKEYKSRVGLWKHKKECLGDVQKCEVLEKEIKHHEPTDKELIMMLIKENSDFKSMMIKMLENGTHNTSNTINTVTNSHNKAFNLNLFLNETCKDAMNINDFVESIKLQVSDLENVGEVGFVEGISNIIVKNLNAMDITKRPIHCTDKKREIIYIKDDNSWEKDESQCKMRRMIKKVVSKNQRLIPKFKEQNPEYNKSYSKVSDKYNKLIIESMGGSGDNDLEKEDKIIRNIAKNIIIDKSI
jgi:hypothetical protein